MKGGLMEKGRREMYREGGRQRRAHSRRGKSRERGKLDYKKDERKNGVKV